MLTVIANLVSIFSSYSLDSASNMDAQLIPVFNKTFKGSKGGLQASNDGFKKLGTFSLQNSKLQPGWRV